MTNFGVFGTLKSINEFAKEAEIEIAPGVVIKVHSQTLAKVVDPDAPRSVEEAQARAEAEQAALGERVRGHRRRHPRRPRVR